MKVKNTPNRTQVSCTKQPYLLIFSQDISNSSVSKNTGRLREDYSKITGRIRFKAYSCLLYGSYLAFMSKFEYTLSINWFFIPKRRKVDCLFRHHSQP